MKNVQHILIAILFPFIEESMMSPNKQILSNSSCPTPSIVLSLLLPSEPCLLKLARFLIQNSEY